MFQNVVLNAAVADASLQNVVFLEDCVATASETGNVFISVYKAVPQHVDVQKQNLMSKSTMLILLIKCMRILISIPTRN